MAYTTGLPPHAIERYSRHLLVPEIGVQGQDALCNASVLIVGAGGLGCPAALYLAGSGVGVIGLVDFDDVEASNIHRQVIHATSRVGMNKAESAKVILDDLNPLVEVHTHAVALTADNALQLMAPYDVVLDASDNVATRYLVNDAAIMTGKPLVSASALRLEGQLTVYGHNGGPCYRCLYPTPPPASSVTNCSDGGVLGVVPGIMGTLQALEAIKIITGMGVSLSQRLLFFDASDTTFRTAKLRPRKTDCPVCGDDPSITELIDYVQFCGAGHSDKDSPADFEARGPAVQDADRVSITQYAEILNSGTPHVCLDVRGSLHYAICAFEHATHVPLSQLREPDGVAAVLAAATAEDGSVLPVYTLCRRGVASRRAFHALKDAGYDGPLFNIDGGLTAWKTHIDPMFPLY